MVRFSVDLLVFKSRLPGTEKKFVFHVRIIIRQFLAQSLEGHARLMPEQRGAFLS